MLICSPCQSDRPPIHGDGPVPSTIMGIGEGPGWDEWYKTRRCFTGKSGRELNERILPKMGLNRYEVFICNAYRCAKPRLVNPTPAEAMACSNHWLHADLARVRPYVILAFGGVAWSLFDQSLPISVVHGIPFVRQFGTWTGYVIPILHPAAGLRQSDMMIKILEDAKSIYEDRLLEQCISNTYVAPQDPYPVTDYREITTLSEQDEYWYLCQDWMGLDTESDTSETDRLHEAPPWCLTYSLAPGTGRLIMAHRRDLLDDLDARIRRYRMLTSMHNALFDLTMASRMGVTLDRYIDTMLRANTLQTLPKGLKALAYRLLHMTMKDFVDVTTAPSNQQAIQYLSEFVRCQKAKYEYEHFLKSGARKGQSELRWRKDRPSIVGRAVTQSNAAIKDFGASPIRLVDPAYSQPKEDDTVESQPTTTIWDRWDNWNPDVRSAITSAFPGIPFPRRSITWAPRAEAIEYACLSNSSMVRVPNGKLAIGDIVRKRYAGPVLSVGEDGNVVERNVTGWYKNDHPSGVGWLSVRTTVSNDSNRHFPARYTPDHRLLTTAGWKTVSSLTPEDHIVLPYEKFDSVEMALVVGSGGADGTFSKRHESGMTALDISHCKKQREYIEWKASLLLPRHLSKLSHYDHRKHPFSTLSTIVHPELNQIRDLLYLGGKKQYTKDWLKLVGVFELALMYQDNGTIGRRTAPRIYVPGSCTWENAVDLQDLILGMGIKCSAYTVRKQPAQYAVHIWAKSTEDFCHMLAPYVHPSMRYKLTVGCENDPFIESPTRVKRGMVTTQVVEVYSSPSTRAGDHTASYCIDVEVTHNFLTNMEVAHNCRDADASMRLHPELRKRIYGAGRSVPPGA